MGFFFFTKLATIFVPVAGCIFFWPSLLTIIIICRSQIRLSSIYHRIMFGMSIMDIISIVSISFATLPMPVDQIYPFQGIKPHGTVLTCEIQSYLQLYGLKGSNFYFTGLTIFYVCMIQLRTDDKKLRKCIEPIIHAVAIMVPAISNTLLLVYELFNPIPYATWCSVGVYPWSCSTNDSNDCIRGRADNYRAKFVLVYSCSIVLLEVIVMICMGWIICGVFINKRRMNNDIDEEDEGEDEEDEETKEWRIIRKTLVRQSLLYIGIFLLTSSFLFISIFTDNSFIQFMKLLSRFLQPFCNASIFLYHKVYNLRLRQVDESLTVKRAIYLLVGRPEEVMEIRLSGISLVSDNDNDNRIMRRRVPSVEQGVDQASKDMDLSHNMPSLEEGVEEASKAVLNISSRSQSSEASIERANKGVYVSYGSREASYMLDLTRVSSNQDYGTRRRSFVASQEIEETKTSNNNGNEVLEDSRVSYSSLHDASTVVQNGRN